jgi:hypothetical protein
LSPRPPRNFSTPVGAARSKAIWISNLPCSNFRTKRCLKNRNRKQPCRML